MKKLDATLFTYKGVEPDDWCLLTSQTIFDFAKEMHCVLGQSPTSKIPDHGGATDRYLLWIRRRDYEAIQTLRKCVDEEDMVFLGPGAFIFPGDDPGIIEVHT